MDNKRLILASVFVFSLFMLWDAWQKFNAPPPPVQAAVVAGQTEGTPVPQVPSVVAAQAAKPTVPVAQIPASDSRSEVITVKTDLFVASISTVGGDLVSLELNHYKSVTDKTQPFLLFEGKHQYAAQSGLIGEGLPNHRTLYTAVKGERELTSDAKEIKLRLEAANADGVKVAKVFTFTRGSYLIGVSHEIDNASQKPITAHAYYQLQRDTSSPEGESGMANTFTGPALYTEQDKYQKLDFKDIEKGKAKFSEKADNGWMAMVQHYFVSAWIPEAKLAREFYVRKLDNNAVTAGIIVPLPALAAGAKASQNVSLYAGPQIQATLRHLAQPVSEGGIGAEGLPLVVDYGWLTIVAAPIFWCLDFIHGMVGNWGWAIVILTICIKLLFFPLSAASYKSMAKMRAVGPRLNALKERYGDDRQKLNAEMMNLYKSEKINPLGGCLPIVIQIPVFIALYWALLGAVEMRDAPWILWIQDLSSQDPYYVLPVIMVVTMLIQTKLNPTPPDPIQAKVMMMMPFVFGAMFFFFPSGLVLYWVINNVLSIAQQWQITRMIEGGGKAANDAKA